MNTQEWAAQTRATIEMHGAPIDTIEDPRALEFLKYGITIGNHTQHVTPGDLASMLEEQPDWFGTQYLRQRGLLTEPPTNRPAWANNTRTIWEPLNDIDQAVLVVHRSQTILAAGACTMLLEQSVLYRLDGTVRSEPVLLLLDSGRDFIEMPLSEGAETLEKFGAAVFELAGMFGPPDRSVKRNTEFGAPHFEEVL